MKIYPINIFSREDLMNICSRIGTDTRALAYLQPKANIFHLFAENIDYRAAGFLKQEMLARGGDVAVTKHVIDGKADSSDVLIMATPSQLRSLQEKLKAMDCWGLKEFREGLATIVKYFTISLVMILVLRRASRRDMSRDNSSTSPFFLAGTELDQ